MDNGKTHLTPYLLFSCLVSTAFCSHATNTIVYEDAFGTGWENWSWSSTLTPDTSRKYSGASSLAVKYSAAWAGVSFRAAAPINTSGYTKLQFAVYGITGSGNMSVYVQTTDAGAASTQIAFTPTINSWKLVEIPLSSFGNPSQIARISIMDQTGKIQPAFNLDKVQLVGTTPPPPSTISLAVDANASRKPISPYIYGINGYNMSNEVALMQTLGVSVRRWGGNHTSRYNWQLDASNLASDWFFENSRQSNATSLPNDSGANRFVINNKTAKAASIITIPMMGYVAKDGNLSTCAFNIREPLIIAFSKFTLLKFQ
jgi:Glycoside hydrolase family 44